MADRAVAFLAGADRLFRRLPVPRLCRGLVRRFDHLMAPRFEAYLRATTAQFAQIGAVLEGAMPAAEAEPANPSGVAAGFWRSGKLLLPRSLS